MELIAKLASNDTPNIRSFPRASEYISIKFADQCLHIIIIKERLNGLKISTKKRKRNTIQISITFYNVQITNDVNHRDKNMLWDNKLFLDPFTTLWHY